LKDKGREKLTNVLGIFDKIRSLKKKLCLGNGAFNTSKLKIEFVLP